MMLSLALTLTGNYLHYANSKTLLQLLLSVTIDASTTLLMSFGLGSFKFLDQNLTSGPELAVIQKEGRFLRPLRSRDNQC